MDRTDASALPAAPRGGIIGWLSRRFFSHIAVDEAWKEAVRGSSSAGVVVHVMRAVSFLDFLCLDFLIRRFRLPPLRFVNDLGPWTVEPRGEAARRVGWTRKTHPDRSLRDVLAQRHGALLFLRRTPNFRAHLAHLGRSTAATERGLELEGDLIRTLVETQRHLDVPILLMPQTFVWSKRPRTHTQSFVDFFFGPTDWPGKLRTFVQFLFNFRNALLRAGEPFDIAQFLREHPDLTDLQAADKIRYALLRRMERERAIVIGPVQKSGPRIRAEVLRNPRVRALIASQSRIDKRGPEAVEKEADRILRKLVATPESWLMALTHRLFERVWNRIYDGIEVDKDGLERVRHVARQGTLILLPSHKSHIDYLVLSDVFYRHGLSPPLIAAGENLSFWPLGPLLRRGGAFFIRRAFQGKKLYTALLDAYVRRVLLEGFNIELFLEGGRSRTGKLLAPKVGVLSMLVDAALALTRRKVFFVPISIGYERVAEERDYVRELSGEEKRPEDLAGLLRVPKILKSRYGRLYIQFGDILPLDRAITDAIQQDGQAPVALSPPQRRALTYKIAHDISQEILRATMVTPTSLVALALLTRGPEGMSYPELTALVAAHAHALAARGARLAPSLLRKTATSTDVVRAQAIEDALSLLRDGRLVTTKKQGETTVHAVPDERRLALEFPKNSILHFFVPAALFSAALAIQTDLSRLYEEFAWLARLFRHEFLLPEAHALRASMEHEIAILQARNEIRCVGRDPTTIEVQNPVTVSQQASLLRSYFESYWIASRACLSLSSAPIKRKEWLKRAQALGQKMLAVGEVRCPESVSRTKLENALSAFHDLHVIRLEGDRVRHREPQDTQSAALADLSPSTREDLELRLRAYIR